MTHLLYGFLPGWTQGKFALLCPFRLDRLAIRRLVLGGSWGLALVSAAIGAAAAGERE